MDLSKEVKPGEDITIPVQIVLNLADQGRVDAVARCLAKQDSEFISAVEWNGERGNQYRDAARDVIATLTRYDLGVRSGGTP